MTIRKNMTNRIRRADYEDLDRIHSLEEEVFESPWSYKMFDLDFKSPFSFYYIIEEEDILKGYFCISLILGEANLNNIAIAKAYRGQGMAKDLLAFLMDFLKEQKARKLLLEVRYNNVEALGLYKSLGFKEIDRRKNYYGHNIDAIIMEKEIEE